MTLTVRLQATMGKPGAEWFEEVITHVRSSGYDPLIREARRRFIEVFGGREEILASGDVHADIAYQYLFQRRIVRYGAKIQYPVAGDVFFTQEGTGILFLALQVTENRAQRGRPQGEIEPKSSLQVGFIGEDGSANSLEAFVEIVSEALKSQGVEPKWQPIQTTSSQFNELHSGDNTRFVLGSSFPQQALDLSATLEDESVRNVAITVRRAGGILTSDLVKKARGEANGVQLAVRRLLEAGLLSQEYVVICSKTSNQINRVNSKEQIEQMAEMGVRCSCGNLISEERVEELIAPTPALQKMLDQSYWMTARLMQQFENLQVPGDQVLLNLQEGAEEIDAFVDLDGTLLMFELKDSEFSMGHAYPFGGRIGLYKPDFAIIVSTKRIAPEVKEYFERVKPQARLVYVENLGQLDVQLGEIMAEVRGQRAQALLSQFDSMASVEIRLVRVLGPRLGIEESERPPGFVEEDDIPF